MLDKRYDILDFSLFTFKTRWGKLLNGARVTSKTFWKRDHTQLQKADQLNSAKKSSSFLVAAKKSGKEIEGNAATRLKYIKRFS